MPTRVGIAGGELEGVADMARWSSGALVVAIIAFLVLMACGFEARSDAGIETIVLLRHGEKPPKGLGQLDCKGLNRALALPPVIAKIFGPPNAIFAPDPSHKLLDLPGGRYDYVRPLATIEPTAIFFGLPVNASVGWDDILGLQRALDEPGYHNAIVLVAWEHKTIENIARMLLITHRGDPTLVPIWHGEDFDSLYVIRIARTGNAVKATFAQEHEGLDGQPTACPH
jgi:hypothetical protein